MEFLFDYVFWAGPGQVLRGREAHQRVQERGIHGDAVSKQTGDEAIRQPMERRRLGHERRAGEDGLDQGPLHGFLQKLQSQCVRVVQWSVVLPERRAVAVAGARFRQPEDAAMGSEELYDL